MSFSLIIAILGSKYNACSTFMILTLKCFQNKSKTKLVKSEQKVHKRFLITNLFLKKGRRTKDLEYSLRPKTTHCGEMTKKHCVHFFEFPTSLRPRCIQPRTTDARRGNSLHCTVRPKIHSQSQIFRYGRSIFHLGGT